MLSGGVLIAQVGPILFGYVSDRIFKARKPVVVFLCYCTDLAVDRVSFDNRPITVIDDIWTFHGTQHVIWRSSYRTGNGQGTMSARNLWNYFRHRQQCDILGQCDYSTYCWSASACQPPSLGSRGTSLFRDCLCRGAVPYRWIYANRNRYVFQIGRDARPSKNFFVNGSLRVPGRYVH